MGVYEARAQLGKALKQLMANWAEVKGSWDDPVSRAFERKYLQTLEADMKMAVGGMDHMSLLLSQINRDCD